MFAVNMNSNDVEAIQGFLDQSIKGLHLNTNNIKTDTNKKSNFLISTLIRAHAPKRKKYHVRTHGVIPKHPKFACICSSDFFYA